MSAYLGLYGYRQTVAIHANHYDFYALIAAAMRQADTYNAQRLRAAWPELWDEMQARYNAPGGLLAGEEPAEARS